MIRHLFKMIWNRKRVNALIMVEIFLSFIVLFAVTTMIVFHIDRFNRPTGFSPHDKWMVFPDPKLPMDKKYSLQRVVGKRNLLMAMRNLPEIESIAGTTTFPYNNSMSSTGFDYDGRTIGSEIADVSDDFASVLGLRLVEGRWFDNTDDAAPDLPMVINAKLKRELFGDQSALGKSFDTSRGMRGKIIGVVEEFRRGGEFYTPGNFIFRRLKMEDTSGRQWWGFAIKLKPGTTAAFQGKLYQALSAAEPGWSFEIGTIEKMRESKFEGTLSPLIAFGLVAVFLLLMVGLGLIGVLWQNVSQRTREIGLRRAIGGTAQMLYRQILGELFVIATLGILAATLVVMQAPLLNLITSVKPGVFITGLGISFGLMYLLTFICGLYPSWLAMEVHPSEALHYE